MRAGVFGTSFIAGWNGSGLPAIGSDAAFNLQSPLHVPGLDAAAYYNTSPAAGEVSPATGTPYGECYCDDTKWGKPALMKYRKMGNDGHAEEGGESEEYWPYHCSG